MTTLVTKIFDVVLVEGQGYAGNYPLLIDNGFTYWTAGRAYAANDVVAPWPPSSSPLFFRASPAGVAGNVPPTWPTSPGQSVADGAGALVWTAQAATSYPVDLSTATAVMKFRAAPDAPGAELLALTQADGLTLTLGNIGIVVSPARVAALLAATTYGSQSCLVTFAGTDPETPWIGAFQIRRSSAGR